MDYRSCLELLFGSTSKFGLENMQKVLDALGNPQNSFQIVHVAGTNGKGSVVTKTAKGLQLQGFKVGLYTSPHISSFRERIKVNGKMIGDDEVVKHFKTASSTGIKLSFFEYATVIAYLHFIEQKVDIAVVETGLGGRLDATNVCTPILSAITSISLDHTKILGNCREDIAREKAGIIKPNVACVIGPRAKAEAIEQVAKAYHAPLIYVEGAFADYETENRAVARKLLEVLKVSDTNIAEALLSLPECRFQKVGRAILDVAHNPDGMKRLFEQVRGRYPDRKLCVVAAFSEDKDVAGCLDEIAKHTDTLYCVQANSERALDVCSLVQMAQGKFHHLFYDKNLEQGIRSALEYGEKNEQLVLICGTFYIMSKARQLLGLVDASDPEIRR